MKPFAAWPEWLRSFLRFQAWVAVFIAWLVLVDVAFRFLSTVHPVVGGFLLGVLGWIAWRCLRAPLHRLWAYLEDNI